MKAILTLCVVVLSVVSVNAAPDLPEFDFTKPEVCREWRPLHHVERLVHGPEGLEITVAGEDPYILGPARDYPTNTPLWVIVRLKADEGGAAQIFYHRQQPTEAESVWLPVEGGNWVEARTVIEGLGPGYRLRLDPPGQRGKVVLGSIRFATAAPLKAPTWPPADPPNLAGAVSLRSGAAELRVAGGGFRLIFNERSVAESHSRPLIGYVVGEELRWLDLHGAPTGPATLRTSPNGATISLTARDPDGATWHLDQEFAPGSIPGTFRYQTSVRVTQERLVAYLPMVLLVAGRGEGEAKQQALFAGLEYLDNEPSSSEADLIGPESRRQVPANHKITFPLMTVLRHGFYAGLIWDHSAEYAALFDSPDRIYGTGGHVMGVLFPGSDGFNRREGAVMPSRPEKLEAGRSLTLIGHLLAGQGSSVVPAMQTYLALRGLPPVPASGYDLSQYIRLAARGWLDSKAREGNRYRHAVWPGFGAQPAADAALYMQWLGARCPDPALRQRLDNAEREALAAVTPAHWNESAVSHLRYPLASLVYGHLTENADREAERARGLLRQFAPDGTIPYRSRPGGENYGRTHFAPDANGLTAQVVEKALESALFSGDNALIEQALARLRDLGKFRNTVPRGAQTWEVPLHTPDILASAHLVRAYTLGYEITGEPAMLDEAIYWAWTGVPFVYLIAPVGQKDRPYGTIAVYGATGWRAPVWFGRPVQWCGLVYADALYRLQRHHTNGPWRQLADGITAVGVFYTWPEDDRDRMGLLPDVWEMLAQRREGPAINPGTVQANATRLYGQGSLYDSVVFRAGGRRLSVHAPGDIARLEEMPRGLRFKVHPWPKGEYRVLVNGVEAAPALRINGQVASVAAPHEYQPNRGRLILHLTGQAEVQLAWP